MTTDFDTPIIAIAMAKAELDITLVQETIKDLDAIIEKLESEKLSIGERIDAVRARKEQWQSRLRSLQNAKNGDTAVRLRKGEALEKINAFYDTQPDGTGLNMTDIAAKTQLPWSSVRNSLQRARSGYYERERLWYRGEAPAEVNGHPKESPRRTVGDRGSAASNLGSGKAADSSPTRASVP